MRKGLSIAQNEILMILDADLMVPPEDTPKFYHAIRLDRGEFINGSRLVYTPSTLLFRRCHTVKAGKTCSL